MSSANLPLTLPDSIQPFLPRLSRPAWPLEPSSGIVGGSTNMNFDLPCGWQPYQEPWSRDHLVQEQAIAFGSTIELFTFRTYSSALTSYLTFVRLHQLPVEPTEKTLSFFVVYMSHPRSVRSYLSGIVQQLETVFPSVKKQLVTPR